MGTYTALEVKCKVKLDEVHLVQKLHEVHDWNELDSHIAYNWSKVGRCNFIPFGVQNVSVREWGFDNDGFSKFDGEIWHFCCSLKNYEREIDQFFLKVLPHIAESLEICRTKCEGCDEENWILSSGTIVRKDNK